MNQEQQTLYIPMGVKPEAEWFPGFGKQQLWQSTIGSMLAIVLALLIWILKGSVPFAVVTFLSGVAASVMITTKDRHNLSVLDQLRFMVKFKKSQKCYPCMKEVQEWLGHSDYATTANIYSHLEYNSKVSSAQIMSDVLSIK